MGEREILRERETQVEFEASDEFGICSDHEDGTEELFKARNSDIFGAGLNVEFIFKSPE